MELSFKVVKGINIVALLFISFGAYGLAILGALQVCAAIFYLLLFPKDKLIHLYFILVGVFFLVWDGKLGWIFILPFGLALLLTYIIHFQKPTL